MPLPTRMKQLRVNEAVKLNKLVYPWIVELAKEQPAPFPEIQSI